MFFGKREQPTCHVCFTLPPGTIQRSLSNCLSPCVRVMFSLQALHDDERQIRIIDNSLVQNEDMLSLSYCRARSREESLAQTNAA